MLQKGRNVLWCVKEQRWFEKKNHIFIKRDVYYNQHLNPVEHHYLLYIIHHPVLNWEKKVSSVNKCKSQRLFFFIWAFMWGVLCSPNHNSLNFYGIPKGQPKIPHFFYHPTSSFQGGNIYLCTGSRLWNNVVQFSYLWLTFISRLVWLSLKKN